MGAVELFRHTPRAALPLHSRPACVVRRPRCSVPQRARKHADGRRAAPGVRACAAGDSSAAAAPISASAICSCTARNTSGVSSPCLRAAGRGRSAPQADGRHCLPLTWTSGTAQQDNHSVLHVMRPTAKQQSCAAGSFPPQENKNARRQRAAPARLPSHLPPGASRRRPRPETRLYLACSRRRQSGRHPSAAPQAPTLQTRASIGKALEQSPTTLIRQLLAVPPAAPQPEFLHHSTLPPRQVVALPAGQTVSAGPSAPCLSRCWPPLALPV